MSLKHSTKVSLALLTAVLAVSGCSSSDDETADSDPTTTAASDEGASSSGSESEPDESTSGGYTADDEGSGSLTVDGVENEGFLGECEIARANGAEDVGDQSALGDDTEIGLVAFSGTTDDGTSVVAEVVCVTQNAFS